VKTFGARVNSARTPDQTDLSHFYSENFFNLLDRAVRGIALTHVTDIGDSARLFALVHIAGADAVISAWNNKRRYNFWRPSTAILEGDHDGNRHTVGDPSWLPFLNDPPYPDYTSGANSVTAAVMRTLARFFHSDVFTFDVTSTAPLAVQKTRTYSRFSDVAADVVEVRILQGIHFRFADEWGRIQGTLAAELAFHRVLRPVH
jgi:hypothetical protein